MHRRIPTLLAFVFLLSITAHAQYPAQVDPNLTLGGPGQDYDYVEKSMGLVSAEIEWSKIASTKATNPDVKALAEETVSQEMPVANALVLEAKADKVKVPNGLSGKYKKESEKLNGLSGADFDKEYVNALVKVQHEDVGESRDEVKLSRNSGLVDFATKDSTLVTKRNDEAMKLQKQLGK